MWWNNVETKPYGGYPQFYDVKITQLIEQVNPGGQVWNVRVGRKHHAPCRVFEGNDHFRRGRQGGPGGDRYIPTDQEWRFVNIYEDTATSMRALVENIDKSGFTRDEPWRLSGSSLPEHETYFFYPATDLQPLHVSGLFGRLPAQGDLQTAGRRHRVDRPEPVPWVQEVRGAVPVQKPMYRGTTGCRRSVLPVIRASGQRPLTGGEPMETRCMAACVGKIRMQSLMRIGEDGLWAKTAGIPCTTRFVWSRWRSRCIRSGAPSPTATTSRHGIAPRLCAADVWPGRG